MRLQQVPTGSPLLTYAETAELLSNVAGHERYRPRADELVRRRRRSGDRGGRSCDMGAGWEHVPGPFRGLLSPYRKDIKSISSTRPALDVNGKLLATGRGAALRRWRGADDRRRRGVGCAGSSCQEVDRPAGGVPGGDGPAAPAAPQGRSGSGVQDLAGSKRLRPLRSRSGATAAASKISGRSRQSRVMGVETYRDGQNRGIGVAGWNLDPVGVRRQCHCVVRDLAILGDALSAQPGQGRNSRSGCAASDRSKPVSTG